MSGIFRPGGVRSDDCRNGQYSQDYWSQDWCHLFLAMASSRTRVLRLWVSVWVIWFSSASRCCWALSCRVSSLAPASIFLSVSSSIAEADSSSLKWFSKSLLSCSNCFNSSVIFIVSGLSLMILFSKFFTKIMFFLCLPKWRPPCHE